MQYPLKTLRWKNILENISFHGSLKLKYLPKPTDKLCILVSKCSGIFENQLLLHD